MKAKRGDIVAIRYDAGFPLHPGSKVSEKFRLARVVRARRKDGKVTHITRPSEFPIPPAQLNIQGMCDWLRLNVIGWDDENERSVMEVIE